MPKKKQKQKAGRFPGPVILISRNVAVLQGELQQNYLKSYRLQLPVRNKDGSGMEMGNKEIIGEARYGT
jgi:hypothetical protein